MSNEHGWLSRTTVKPAVESLVERLNEMITKRENARLPDIDIVERSVVLDRLRANQEVRQSLFYGSVGVGDHDEDSKTTVYLSTAVGAHYFSELNIRRWTSWEGRLFTRARVAAEEQELPSEMEYGPPYDVAIRPIGPLGIYDFSDGKLTKWRLYVPVSAEETGLAEPVTETADFETAPETVTKGIKERPAFGLKQIIRTLDIDQDDQIRGPMEGIFILTGGPGVGKTTVALHRIPYLINEQRHYHPKLQDLNAANADPIFSQMDTLVVVWQEHLVPYLQECLMELGLTDFNDKNGNVKHIEKWVDFHLRPYVATGPDPKTHYRIEKQEDKWIATAKLSLSEMDVEKFLDSDHLIVAESWQSVAETVAEIRQSFVDGGYPNLFKTSVDRSSFRLTVQTVLKLEKHLKDYLAYARDELKLEQKDVQVKHAGETDKKWNARKESVRRLSEIIKKASTKISKLRENELKRLSDYPRFLYAFYESDIVGNRLSQWQQLQEADPVARFSERIGVQSSRRALTIVDRYHLLWIIRFLTRESTSELEQFAPFREYSHVLIDEAQYYEPLVIRFFADLAKLSSGGTMTIVGDLEQRVSNDGGLIQWEDAGLKVEANRIVRLVTNYRWSEAVYEFAECYKVAARLDEELKRPKKWFSGPGMPAELMVYNARDEEIEWITSRIWQFKNEHDGLPQEKWTQG